MTSDGAPTRTPQVIRFRDAVTKQQISLVGTMHFNPASIARAREEVLKQAKDKLGAVVVESCISRWNRSLEIAPPGSSAQQLTLSEMQVAAGVAFEQGVPVMLGDADVGPLTDRLRKGAVRFFKDALMPFDGGWQSILEDYVRTISKIVNTTDVAASALLLEREAPLSFLDILQPTLLLGLPKAILSYVFSFAIKAPIAFAIFFSSLLTLEMVAQIFDSTIESGLSGSGGTEAIVFPIAALSLLLNIVSLFLLPRLLLVEMLEQRNAQLARSIRRAAKEQNGSVVAILGAAHVNDVARLLMSEAHPDGDGLENDGVWWTPPPNVSLGWV